MGPVGKPAKECLLFGPRLGHLADADTEAAAVGAAEAEAATVGSATGAAVAEAVTTVDAVGAAPPVPASSFFAEGVEPQPTRPSTKTLRNATRFIFFSKFTFELKVS